MKRAGLWRQNTNSLESSKHLSMHLNEYKTTIPQNNSSWIWLIIFDTFLFCFPFFSVYLTFRTHFTGFGGGLPILLPSTALKICFLLDFSIWIKSNQVDNWQDLAPQGRLSIPCSNMYFHCTYINSTLFLGFALYVYRAEWRRSLGLLVARGYLSRLSCLSFHNIAPSGQISSSLHK